MFSAPAPGSKFFNAAIGFTGGAGLGAVGAVKIATVTGVIVVEKIIAFNYTALASGGAATIALGVTGSTGLFVAATAYTALDGAKLWTSTTPTAKGVALPAAMKDIVVTDPGDNTGIDIALTVAVAAITGGIMRLGIIWRPLSPAGNLA